MSSRAPKVKVKVGDPVLVKHGNDGKTTYSAVVLSIIDIDIKGKEDDNVNVNDNEDGLSTSAFPTSTVKSKANGKVKVQYTICQSKEIVEMDRVVPVEINGGRPRRAARKRPDYFVSAATTATTKTTGSGDGGDDDGDGNAVKAKAKAEKASGVGGSFGDGDEDEGGEDDGEDDYEDDYDDDDGDDDDDGQLYHNTRKKSTKKNVAPRRTKRKKRMVNINTKKVKTVKRRLSRSKPLAGKRTSKIQKSKSKPKRSNLNDSDQFDELESDSDADTDIDTNANADVGTRSNISRERPTREKKVPNYFMGKPQPLTQRLEGNSNSSDGDGDGDGNGDDDDYKFHGSNVESKNRIIDVDGIHNVNSNNGGEEESSNDELHSIIDIDGGDNDNSNDDDDDDRTVKIQIHDDDDDDYYDFHTDGEEEEKQQKQKQKEDYKEEEKEVNSTTKSNEYQHEQHEHEKDDYMSAKEFDSSDDEYGLMLQKLNREQEEKTKAPLQEGNKESPTEQGDDENNNGDDDSEKLETGKEDNIHESKDGNDSEITHSLISSGGIKSTDNDAAYDWKESKSFFPTKEKEVGNFLIKLELWKKKGMEKKANQKKSDRYLTRAKYLFDRDGKPRKTFRRMNCRGKTGSIGSLFGGLGTDPWPRPKAIPLFNGGVNPFIKENELFVAGRSDWNPWTPCYAGDAGFVHHSVFEEIDDEQKNFHMFIHCSDKPNESHYHGPEAKGKYIYIGRYKRDEECGLDTINESFKKFTEKSQWTMAEWFRRKTKTEFQYRSPSGKQSILSNTGMISDDQVTSWEELRDRAGQVNREEWGRLSEEKKDIFVWIEMLWVADYYIKVIPVEFVNYDEDVYKALIDIDAVNGQIAENEDQLGPV